MKISKLAMLFSAVLLTTLFSIYFTTYADSYASKSDRDVLTYSDSTKSSDCCGQMKNCSDMDHGSMNNHMDHGSMHNHMDMDNSSMDGQINMDKDNSNTDMNSDEHQHEKNDNTKSDHSSDCMGH